MTAISVRINAPHSFGEAQVKMAEPLTPIEDDSENDPGTSLDGSNVSTSKRSPTSRSKRRQRKISGENLEGQDSSEKSQDDMDSSTLSARSKRFGVRLKKGASRVIGGSRRSMDDSSSSSKLRVRRVASTGDEYDYSEGLDDSSSNHTAPPSTSSRRFVGGRSRKQSQRVTWNRTGKYERLDEDGDNHTTRSDCDAPLRQRPSTYMDKALPRFSARDFSTRNSAGVDAAKKRASTLMAMSKRDFKKHLREEMKELKKARVKSYKAKQALANMDDIEEVSEMARKAEELRRRRASQGSTRSSLTSLGCSTIGSLEPHSEEFDVETPDTCQSTLDGTPASVTICTIVDGADIDAEGLQLPLTLPLTGEDEEEDEDVSNLQGPELSGTYPGDLDPIIESRDSADSRETQQTFLEAVSEDIERRLQESEVKGKKLMPAGGDEMHEASSETSATASLMTHDEDNFMLEDAPSRKNFLTCWEEDCLELEESTRALQERIAKLQKSLEQTQLDEIQQIKEVRKAICSAERKEAAAAEVHRQVAKKVRGVSFAATTSEEEPAKKEKGVSFSASIEEPPKVNPDAMINALEMQNKMRRRESQGLNLQLLSLFQSTDRLQKATQETKKYSKELEQLLVRPAQDKLDKLLVEVQGCQLEQQTLEREIRKARKDAERARKTRRIYRYAVIRLLHKVQHRAWTDTVLLAAINDIPQTITSREEWVRDPHVKHERKTSFFGLW